jgi:RNA polymerase sporulation-specific sigma factor
VIGLNDQNSHLTDTSEADELALISLAGQGDEKALEMILEKYKNLVRCVSRAYYMVCGEVEDVIQEGMIGLYKAIRDYNPSKSPSFKGFAIMCIKRQIISSIKSTTRMKHIPNNKYVHLDQPGEDDLRIITINKSGRERFSSIEDIIVDKEESEYILKKMYEELSPFELKVILFYFKGDTYNEMSIKLKKSEKSIDNAIQRIRKKMQKYYRK